MLQGYELDSSVNVSLLIFCDVDNYNKCHNTPLNKWDA